MGAFKTCCGCAPLQYGVIAIGIFEIFWYGSGIIVSGFTPQAITHLISISVMACLMFGAVRVRAMWSKYLFFNKIILFSQKSRYWFIPFFIHQIIFYIILGYGLVVLVLFSSILGAVESVNRDNEEATKNIHYLKMGSGLAALIFAIIIGKKVKNLMWETDNEWIIVFILFRLVNIFHVGGYQLLQWTGKRRRLTSL